MHCTVCTACTALARALGISGYAPDSQLVDVPYPLYPVPTGWVVQSWSWHGSIVRRFEVARHRVNEMALKGKAITEPLSAARGVILITAHHLSDPSSSVYKFVDLPASPDSYYTRDYEVVHRGKATTPLVIDNGKLYHRLWCPPCEITVTFTAYMLLVHVYHWWDTFNTCTGPF